MATDNAGRTSRTETIAAALSAEIAAGHYVVGSRFLTEPELKQRFNVGRHTIRESLKLLTEQGLIGRRRGSRPRVCQRRNIPRNTGIGIAIGQLAARKARIRSAAVGSGTSPLSQPMTTVSPSRYSSFRGIENRMVHPAVSMTASLAVAP